MVLLDRARATPHSNGMDTPNRRNQPERRTLIRRMADRPCVEHGKAWDDPTHECFVSESYEYEKYDGTYVTREDCDRSPCRWPKAHSHWNFDRPVGKGW